MFQPIDQSNEPRMPLLRSFGSFLRRLSINRPLPWSFGSLLYLWSMNIWSFRNWARFTRFRWTSISAVPPDVRKVYDLPRAAVFRGAMPRFFRIGRRVVRG